MSILLRSEYYWHQTACFKIVQPVIQQMTVCLEHTYKNGKNWPVYNHV